MEALDAVAPAVRPAAPVPDACANCGAEIRGPYCHACGQRHLGRRLTLRILWDEFTARFLNLDRGLLHTARALTVAPGQTARAYVEGHRRRLVSPVYYFLIASGLALLAFSFEADAVRALMAESLRAQVARGGFPGSLLPPERVDAYVDAVMRSVELAFTYQVLLNALFMALLLRALFRRRGFNLAEVGVFVLFTSGHLAVLGAAVGLALDVLPLARNVAFGLDLLAGVILTAVYIPVAAVGFFGRPRVRTAALTLLAVALAYALFAVVRDGVLLAYVLLSAP